MTCKNKAVKTFFCAVVFSVCLIGAADAIDVLVGTVTASSSLNLRSGPSASSSVLTAIPKGAKVFIYPTGESWLEASYNGMVGYVSSDYVSTSQDTEGNLGIGSVTGSSVNLRSDASLNAGVLVCLSKGTRVNICGVKDNWYKVTYDSTTGYIYSDYLTTETAASKKESESSGVSSDIVDYAKKFLGVKYCSGGQSPNGFDCSGFTYYVYKQYGINLSRVASAQFANDCVKISKSDLQLGDLVFFANPRASSSSIGHVGIYIGNNSFIHASSPGDVVKITSLSDSYYVRNYICSGRVTA